MTQTIAKLQDGQIRVSIKGALKWAMYDLNSLELVAVGQGLSCAPTTDELAQMTDAAKVFATEQSNVATPAPEATVRVLLNKANFNRALKAVKSVKGQYDPNSQEWIVKASDLEWLGSDVKLAPEHDLNYEMYNKNGVYYG